MAIVRASEAHAEAICGLIRELAASVHQSTSVSGAAVVRFLETPGCGILVAMESSRAVGVLSYSARPSLFHAGTSGLIEDLVVTAERRGRGIGTRLMEAFCSEARRLGWAEMSVSTEKDNSAAISFYKSHGFGEEFVFLERHLKAART